MTTPLLNRRDNEILETFTMGIERAEFEPDLNEDEIVDAVAEALTGLGLTASSQETGGGIQCVVIEHKDGGEITWGTADVTWGASITDEHGEYVSSIETSCPSDSQNIEQIVEAIKGPSLAAGAAVFSS